MKLLDSTTLTSTASSITFSGVPQTYNYLELVFWGTSNTAFFGGPSLRFNGDTGSNYAHFHNYQLNNTGSDWSSTSDNGIELGYRFGNSLTGDFYKITVYNYRGGTYKKVTWRGGGNQSSYAAPALQVVASGGGIWKQTSAITSITLTTLTGLFSVGTRLSLYGEI